MGEFPAHLPGRDDGRSCYAPAESGYVGKNPLNSLDPSGLVRTPWGDFPDGGGLGSSWNEFDVMGIPVAAPIYANLQGYQDSAAITYPPIGSQTVQFPWHWDTVQIGDGLDLFADLRVSIYPGAEGFNHAGIGMNSPNTYGLYPTKKPACLLVGCTVQGKVHRDKEKSISTVVIKTKPAQDAAAQNAINNAIKRPPGYNLYHENCASCVESVLSAAGVKTAPGAMFPNELGSALGCKR